MIVIAIYIHARTQTYTHKTTFKDWVTWLKKKTKNSRCEKRKALLVKGIKLYEPKHGIIFTLYVTRMHMHNKNSVCFSLSGSVLYHENEGFIFRRNFYMQHCRRPAHIRYIKQIYTMCKRERQRRRQSKNGRLCSIWMYMLCVCVCLIFFGAASFCFNYLDDLECSYFVSSRLMLCYFCGRFLYFIVCSSQLSIVLFWFLLADSHLCIWE